MAMVCCNQSNRFQSFIFFKNDKADEDMCKNLAVNYFKNKVEGHKGQDRKGGREIVDEYIDEHV